MNNWLNWVKGLVSAFIGAAADAVTNTIIAPDVFNFKAGLYPLLGSAALKGGLAAALYLKQSPLPPSPPQPLQSPVAPPESEKKDG